MSLRAWFPAVLGFAAIALGPLLPGQDKPAPKDDDEILKLGRVDPYTGGEATAMAQAGVVAYGPFAWADHVTTADVDRVLGEKRFLWLETAHFRIGSSMPSIGWPEDNDARKQLQEEIKALRKKLPKVPERPKKLDPWLRLHLAAHRCEKGYAEYQQLVGVTDADFARNGSQPPHGAFLGLPGKFLLLQCQKKSDMARYVDRFCGAKEDTSTRHYHAQTFQMVHAMSAEGLEGFDESGLHGHMVYALWHNLLNGHNGFAYPLPAWLAEGVAHWHARKVKSVFLNVQIRDDEAVAQEQQVNWPAKVRARAQHEGAFFPFDVMAAWSNPEELGYHGHAQSWSRVDYLLQTDRAKLGALLKQLKAVPPDGTYEAQGGRIRAQAQKLVAELYGLDGPAFDRAWREWVTKTYPKK
ncbi:MAG: hypothetical protein INH34_05980 [Phycisphaerales bacterium]|nr:hypothetical protein [Phycisphaerales bacterium]